METIIKTLGLFFIICIMNSCVKSDSINQEAGIFCKYEITEGCLTFAITNNLGNDVSIRPPYFAPASNLLISYKDEQSKTSRILNKRGSSSAPDYIKVPDGTVYSKIVKIEGVEALEDIDIVYNLVIKNELGKIRELSIKVKAKE